MDRWTSFFSLFDLEDVTTLLRCIVALNAYFLHNICTYRKKEARLIM